MYFCQNQIFISSYVFVVTTVTTKEKKELKSLKFQGTIQISIKAGFCIIPINDESPIYLKFISIVLIQELLFLRNHDLLISTEALGFIQDTSSDLRQIQ